MLEFIRMSLVLNTIHNFSSGEHRFESLGCHSNPDWLDHVSREYINLRTAPNLPLEQVSLEGITIMDTEGIRRKLQERVIPHRTGGGLDVIRSDFGETLSYMVLEQRYQTRIGYKSVRDRETINLPGRGIDAIGIENNGGLTLILSETKVSDENRTPPQVVDRNRDSLSKQLKNHITRHEETSRKIWNTAKLCNDSAIRNDLFAVALRWDERAWDKITVVCCAILIRPRARYTERDFGRLRDNPNALGHARIRFLILCIPNDVGNIIESFHRIITSSVGGNSS